VVYNMLHEDPGNISYSAVGGLSDQIRELRESIELPLMNPELFLRVGIKPPKVILHLYMQFSNLSWIFYIVCSESNMCFLTGRVVVWPPWNWQNPPGTSNCQQH
jgi:hypothetical protein